MKIANSKCVLHLWIVNDFLARNSLSGWSSQGYKVCPTCNANTSFMRVIRKTVYAGHRRFLLVSHSWRKSRKFNRKSEKKNPDIDALIMRISWSNYVDCLIKFWVNMKNMVVKKVLTKVRSKRIELE